MEIKKPLFAVATKGSCRDTRTYASFNNKGWKYDIQFDEQNTESLSKVYNFYLEMAKNSDVDCLILPHDDIYFTEDPIPKLEKLFDQFDIVGVAGPSKIEIKSPCLWHIMGGGFQSGNLHGKVNHIQQNMYGGESTHLSDFGPIPKRVVMIDGVFMAFNRKAIEGVRFDESNPCKFHFYDLATTLQAHLDGYKVGVGDILITHASPGLREFTQDWMNGDKWFLEKYGSDQ